MNEKITEKEWKKKREFTRKKLEIMRTDIDTCKNIGVLLKAEEEYCNILSFQISSILSYWNERSIASRIRFVEGAKDE